MISKTASSIALILSTLGIALATSACAGPDDSDPNANGPSDAPHFDAPTGPTLSLDGPWAFSEDANQNDPAPSMTLDSSSTSSVTVTYDGADGQKCDCNSQHLVIPLGKTFDCDAATLQFDYHTSGSFGATSSSALSIRFCSNGKCDDGGFYGGNQFIGSEQTGHSNCAMPYDNDFPTTPALVEGRNTIALAGLQAKQAGQCNGSFDTIDVHVQGYACFEGADKATSTVANVRIY
jgi:hypothetical protein